MDLCFIICYHYKGPFPFDDLAKISIHWRYLNDGTPPREYEYVTALRLAFSVSIMKWLTTFLLLALCIALIEAAFLPSFLVQDDEPAYDSSTELITECGDKNDLLE